MPKADDLPPEVEWTAEDYLKAAESLTNITALGALDVCSERPGQWVTFEDITARTGRDPARARGDTGGLTSTVRARFGRSNWP